MSTKPTNPPTQSPGSSIVVNAQSGQRQISTQTRLGRHSDTLLGYTLIFPAMLIVAIVLVYPIFFNLNIAVREWNWSMPADAHKPVVGLQNFTDLVSSARFQNSLEVSLKLVVFAIIVQYILGLGLALLLNQQFRGRRIFRAIFIIPMVLAPIVVGIQWRYLLSGNFGIINYVLLELGTTPPSWLSEPKYGLPILIMVDSWMYVPFVTLILLAGLQQIPQDLHEAAMVDGAGSIKRFYYITLPLLRPATAIVLLLRGTEIFRAFDVVYVLTGGGPGRSTEVMGILLYRIAFSEGNFGQAAALAMVIGLIGMVIGAFLIRIIRTEVRLF